MIADALEMLKQIVIDVGDEILQCYGDVDSLDVKHKENNTPVTMVDEMAHQRISQALKLLTPKTPVLSEEGKHLSFEQRTNWSEYWLIDPLDGTKEFIAKTGDFSINIAYIKENLPIFGIVYAPVTGELYYTHEGIAYKKKRGSVPKIIQTAATTNTLRIAVSRHHRGEKLQAFLAKLKQYELVIMGSALKLCLVAEAKADIYLRLGPTSEWDTAAGHHILACAGGRLLNLQGEELQYNTKASLLNPAFIALGDHNFKWRHLLNTL